MSSADLHFSLLRVPVLHILRAAGFHAARPAALDSLVDLAARYVSLLANRTAEYAWASHNEPVPTAADLCRALQSVGALYPQHGALEEQFELDDDMRGLEFFFDWAKGDSNREILRIAGMSRVEGASDPVLGQEPDGVDFLTALKKKHSKTGEESRFQGTALGKPAEEKVLKIDGGGLESIDEWELSLRRQGVRREASSAVHSAATSGMSSPLSDI